MESAVIGLIVGAWIAVTLLLNVRPKFAMQAPSWVRAVTPGWSYFAPEPVSQRYYFLVRGTWEETGPWVEIPSSTRDGRLQAVWQPNRRSIKFYLDAIGSAARSAESQTSDVRADVGYKEFVALAAAYFPTSRAVQFAVPVRVQDLVGL